jgi:hypothetical protein
MMWIDWNDLDDDVKALLSMSDLLRTEEQLMRDLILDAVDPIIATGPLFRFEPREPNEFCISIDVPHPFARVDLAQAWVVAQQDARACQLILEHDDTLDGTLRAYRNHLSWLRFWSVRFPNEEWRERFEMELGARVAGLNRLRDKAKWKFRLEVVEALENV